MSTLRVDIGPPRPALAPWHDRVTARRQNTIEESIRAVVDRLELIVHVHRTTLDAVETAMTVREQYPPPGPRQIRRS